MGSELELRTKERFVLKMLLEIKFDSDKLGVRLPALERAILNQKATMLPEDFAYVQKLLEEELGK